MRLRIGTSRYRYVYYEAENRHNTHHLTHTTVNHLPNLSCRFLFCQSGKKMRLQLSIRNMVIDMTMTKEPNDRIAKLTSTLALKRPIPYQFFQLFTG